MDHLSDERVLAYLDGELPGEETRVASHHLEDCDTCAERLEELRAASEHLSRELRALDVPPPAPAAPTAASAPPARRRLLIAAMLLLAFTGIGLAAVPGSPVRGWIERSAERVAALFAPEETGMAATSAETAAPGAGVGVRPAEGSVHVDIPDPAPGTVMRVRLIRGDRATVRAPGARYRTAPGRLEVLEAGPGEIVLELPERAGSARVDVAGETVLTGVDGELRFLTPSVDSAGGEFSFPLRPSARQP